MPLPPKDGSCPLAGPFLLDVALLKSCLRLHLAMVRKMAALGALLQDKQYLHDDEETHKIEI